MVVAWLRPRSQAGFYVTHDGDCAGTGRPFVVLVFEVFEPGNTEHWLYNPSSRSREQIISLDDYQAVSDEVSLHLGRLRRTLTRTHV